MNLKKFKIGDRIIKEGFTRGEIININIGNSTTNYIETYDILLSDVTMNSQPVVNFIIRSNRLEIDKEFYRNKKIKELLKDE